MHNEKTPPPDGRPAEAKTLNPHSDCTLTHGWCPVKAARVRQSFYNDRFFGGPWPEPVLPCRVPVGVDGADPQGEYPPQWTITSRRVVRPGGRR
jgi:hypothetical protein